MKKIAILTSVLALAACGGGSGGNGGFVPNNAVRIANNNTVDANSGLSMIDINKTRTNKYAIAIRTVSSIENDNDSVDYTSAVRSATRNQTRSPSSSVSVDDYTDEEINNAYTIMNEILLQGNLDGKTNHDILLALALSGMSKTEILDLLDSYNTGDIALDGQILSLSDILVSDQDKGERINDIINNAQSIYDDFGQKFEVTLENARFYDTSGHSHFTFRFDEDGKVTSLKTLENSDDVGTTYTSLGKGKFSTEIQGNEYSFELHFSNPDHTFGKEVVTDETDPEEIYALLLETAQAADPQATNELAALESWLAGNPPIIGANDTCPVTTGCIKHAYMNYTDQITVESKGQQLGLKYSDFGLKLDKSIYHTGSLYEGVTYQEHTVFAGGYEDKRATPTPDMITSDEGITFTGTAFAGVTKKSNNFTSASDYQTPQLHYYNGTAVLNVNKDSDNNLTENLVADFSDDGWYTVTVNGNLSAMPFNGNIQFSGDVTNSDFAVSRDTDNNLVGELEQASMYYYGPSTNNPTEAVGSVQYVERDMNSDDETDWNFKADISFGTKRD